LGLWEKNVLGRIQSRGAECFIAMLLIVFAVAALNVAVQFSGSEEFELGPGAMPVIYAEGSLVFAGVLAIWQSQKRPL
jgi:hypothetical protein